MSCGHTGRRRVRWKGSQARRCPPGLAPANWHRAENGPVVTGHVPRAMIELTLTEPDDPKAVRLGSRATGRSSRHCCGLSAPKRRPERKTRRVESVGALGPSSAWTPRWQVHLLGRNRRQQGGRSTSQYSRCAHGAKLPPGSSVRLGSQRVSLGECADRAPRSPITASSAACRLGRDRGGPARRCTA